MVKIVLDTTIQASSLYCWNITISSNHLNGTFKNCYTRKNNNLAILCLKYYQTLGVFVSCYLSQFQSSCYTVYWQSCNNLWYSPKVQLCVQGQILSVLIFCITALLLIAHPVWKILSLFDHFGPSHGSLRRVNAISAR